MAPRPAASGWPWPSSSTRCTSGTRPTGSGSAATWASSAKSSTSPCNIYVVADTHHRQDAYATRSPRMRLLILRSMLLCCLLLALSPLCSSPVGAETIARCGEGFLEEIDGCLVLHVKGKPYHMGYQHGALLKEEVR